MTLLQWFTTWLSGHPHFVVGEPTQPYLLRWYVLPRNRWINIYLHKFLRDDDDRAMHDHPWPSASLLLHGRYIEQTASGRRLYRTGAIVMRSADHAHRIELIKGVPCWTLFCTGRRIRDWGFHCPNGWVPWQDFVKPTDKGQIGRGCGDH